VSKCAAGSTGSNSLIQGLSYFTVRASGSKTRFNTTGDPAVRSDLASVLAKLKLTSEHTDTLGYLKDCPQQAWGWDDC